jgi:hypothetical protein
MRRPSRAAPVGRSGDSSRAGGKADNPVTRSVAVLQGGVRGALREGADGPCHSLQHWRRRASDLPGGAMPSNKFPGAPNRSTRAPQKMNPVDEPPNAMRLFWSGPHAWPGFESQNGLPPLPKHSGVYLWTFPYQDGFLIYAAGLTRQLFRQRFGQHKREYARCLQRPRPRSSRKWRPVGDLARLRLLARPRR